MNMDEMQKAIQERKDIWKILECPVCFEVVTPPIFMCKSGHHICNMCKQNWLNCPVCKTEIISTRNRTLESVVEAISLPCPYKTHGCWQVTLLRERQKHVEHCQFKPFKCPLSGCTEIVTACDKFKDHLEEKHNVPCNVKWHSHSPIGHIMFDFPNHTVEDDMVLLDLFDRGSSIVLYRQAQMPPYLLICWCQIAHDGGANYEYELIFENASGQKSTFSGQVHMASVTFDEVQNSGNFLSVRKIPRGRLTILIREKDK